ncbi:Ig-like domain-containing protein, partial [Arthrospira platensis SPKY1]|nr:Ig-like domain-containing protein [Arthrospira platensis SPKY1]
DDDSYTNVANPLLTGRGEPGAQIVITNTVTNAQYTGITVDQDGNWSFRIPAIPAGQDGVFNFSVVATDIAGNTDDDTIEFTLDRVAPEVSGRLDASVDTGRFNNDQITNNLNPVFSGTGEEGARITLTFNN